MNFIKLMLISALFLSCTHPEPKQIGNTGEYKLIYCDREEDCFKAAAKACPNGYRITKYGNTRPERFKCKVK